MKMLTKILGNQHPHGELGVRLAFDAVSSEQALKEVRSHLKGLEKMFDVGWLAGVEKCAPALVTEQLKEAARLIAQARQALDQTVPSPAQMPEGL